jgi:hypothetical protein
VKKCRQRRVPEWCSACSMRGLNSASHGEQGEQQQPGHASDFGKHLGDQPPHAPSLRHIRGELDPECFYLAAFAHRISRTCISSVTSRFAGSGSRHPPQQGVVVIAEEGRASRPTGSDRRDFTRFFICLEGLTTYPALYAPFGGPR